MTDNKLTVLKGKTIKNEAEALISQAIDKNVPVETMEKLLAMRRELKAEKAKEDFDKSMARFQSECPTIVKTKEVKTRSGVVAYKYAPIDSIVSQVKEALHKNGFSYSTNMELLDSGVKVSVKVTHSAGHSEITEMAVPLGNKTDIMSQSQVVAAAQTFAKRYAFCNAFGILTGDEDTDAAPQVPTPPIAQAKTVTASPAPRMSFEQQKKIFALLTEKGKSKIDLEGYLEKAFNKDSVSKLTVQQASIVIEKLNSMPDVEESTGVTYSEHLADIKREPEINIDEVAEGIDKMKGGEK